MRMSSEADFLLTRVAITTTMMEIFLLILNEQEQCMKEQYQLECGEDVCSY